MGLHNLPQDYIEITKYNRRDYVGLQKNSRRDYKNNRRDYIWDYKTPMGLQRDYKTIQGLRYGYVGITIRLRWGYNTVTLGLQYGYTWITFIYLPLGRVVTRNPGTLQRQISQNVTLDFREKLSKNPIYYSDNFHKK